MALLSLKKKNKHSQAQTSAAYTKALITKKIGFNERAFDRDWYLAWCMISALLWKAISVVCWSIPPDRCNRITVDQRIKNAYQNKINSVYVEKYSVTGRVSRIVNISSPLNPTRKKLAFTFKCGYTRKNIVLTTIRVVSNWVSPYRTFFQDITS